MADVSDDERVEDQEEGVTMETLWQHEKRRAERAEAAMEANIATLELCQEAVVELERKLYLAGTDLIEVRDQRDAARTERNALRAENERLEPGEFVQEWEGRPYMQHQVMVWEECDEADRHMDGECLCARPAYLVLPEPQESE